MLTTFIFSTLTLPSFSYVWRISPLFFPSPSYIGAFVVFSQHDILLYYASFLCEISFAFLSVLSNYFLFFYFFVLQLHNVLFSLFVSCVMWCSGLFEFSRFAVSACLSLWLSVMILWILLSFSSFLNFIAWTSMDFFEDGIFTFIPFGNVMLLYQRWNIGERHMPYECI